ncbi:MAG: hypothetical protein KGY48_13385 [Wenzhouxiangellaceae bacterium]|nr:hypothetical protein [Wenzhouxiangellaceae bacterium]MBS3747960.1 hypothetical protein [Wenzhouxiangellaceae bacterium]MBS3822571.1 hypothetical protein [Wenzhouxiangellaceae bacterium]
MLELGALKPAVGEEDEAEALYQLVARWGNADATAMLEARENPVPHAELSFARMQSLEIQNNQMRRRAHRRSPADELQEIVDYAAAIAAND